MNPLTPERLADIEKRCNKFRDSGYMWERFAQYAVVDLGDLLSEIKRLRERDSELTDLLDLAHDDFQRVEALTDDTELRGIALRGQAKIRQNVPVIRQRDELENAVIKLDGLNDQLRAQLSDARAALNKALLDNADLVEYAANLTLAGPGKTPNASLPPIGEGPRRKMLVTIEVPADFEKRLDNQWVVEREIHADRWNWKWADYNAALQPGRE
jgi:hypothetical protein